MEEELEQIKLRLAYLENIVFRHDRNLSESKVDINDKVIKLLDNIIRKEESQWLMMKCFI